MRSLLVFVMAAVVSMATVLWTKRASAQMCNTDCLTMVQWQVCGTCTFNCRKVKIGVKICGGMTLPFHLEAGGGTCKEAGPMLVIEKCVFCDPECSNIPSEADGCDTCVNDFAAPDTDCVTS